MHWGGKSRGQIHKTINLSQGIRVLADFASAELPTAGAHLHLQRSECCFGSTSGWFFLITALVNCLCESQIWDWICQFYYRCPGIRYCHVDVARERGERSVWGLIHIFSPFFAEEWCPWYAKFWGLPCPVQAESFWASLSCGHPSQD